MITLHITPVFSGGHLYTVTTYVVVYGYSDGGGGDSSGGDGGKTDRDSSADENCSTCSAGGTGSNDNSDDTDEGIVTAVVYEDCDGGMVDIYGNCVEKTPCDEIKSQMEDADFKEKMEILKDSTGLKHETGYSQNSDGTFEKLLPVRNGHSLDIRIGLYSDIKGFIHAHLDSFCNSAKTTSLLSFC